VVAGYLGSLGRILAKATTRLPRRSVLPCPRTRGPARSAAPRLPAWHSLRRRSPGSGVDGLAALPCHRRSWTTGWNCHSTKMRSELLHRGRRNAAGSPSWSAAKGHTLQYCWGPARRRLVYRQAIAVTAHQCGLTTRSTRTPTGGAARLGGRRLPWFVRPHGTCSLVGRESVLGQVPLRAGANLRARRASAHRHLPLHRLPTRERVGVYFLWGLAHPAVR